MPYTFTDADVLALKKALASGAATVDLPDRRITYRSVDEITKALALVQAEQIRATGGRRVGRIRARTDKGF